ncbi:MAG: family 78 glycoside hydrolase catalytic domain [Thermoguttaceae bacterium]|jgi:alpha-L-rhamnosidase
MRRSIMSCVSAFLGLATLVTMGVAANAAVLLTPEQQLKLPLPRASRVEGRVQPVGVDAANPRLSWLSFSQDESLRNRSQSAYQVIVSSSLSKLNNDEGDLWDSGKVESDASNFVPYDGAPLQSMTRYFWKVRIWDEKGARSLWSRPSSWVQGFVKPEDWSAQWIGQPEEVRPDIDLSGAGWIAAPEEKETDSGYAPEYFRKEFTLDCPQSDLDEQNLSALLYYAADQKFEIYVNGHRAGYSIGMVYNPDQLRSLDVSEYLVTGKNVIAIVVSNDTKRPNDTKFGDGTLYPTALVAKLFVRALDKSNAPENLPTPNRFGKPTDVILTVGTDSTWKASLSGGDGWNSLDFDDSNWANATRASFVAENDEANLDSAPWGKLRRRTETISPAFQKTFETDKTIASAYLAVCAPGLFEAYVDGQKVQPQLLSPSFTRYDRRLLYNVLDVTNYFAPNEKEHELQLLLGHSWYDVRSIVTWNFDAAPWRDFPRVRAELKLTYVDGSTETIATDSSWTYSTSPVLFDCVRQGEIVDGAWKREILGNAVVVPEPSGNPKIVAQKVDVSRVTDVYPAASVKEVDPGLYVVDMGRNSAGWARVRIRGQKKGDVIRFRYSERADDSGHIERRDIALHFMEGTPACMTGMKGGFQTDFYFCNGDEEEFFEPRFTYNGYQYIEVLGLRHAPEPSDFLGMRINTAFGETGQFSCDNELLNQLQAATLESYRCNFVAGFPTDCPHREKNGWTGDAQLACELAQYNFENTAGYEKWIDDLIDEQRPNGNLPGIVPTGDWGYPWGNGPAWDSALILIPWYLYVYRGDVKILEDSFEAMKKYVDYMTSRAHENGLVDHGLGDWVFYETNTPVEVTSTGYYYVDSKIVAQTAKILGRQEDYEKYSALAEKIRADYNKALYKGDGVYSINGQTTQSCAIHQGFTLTLPEADQKAVFDRLVENVEKTDGHFDVGIFGAKYILRTLSENGRTDLALRLMLQETRPAMSDWIKRGAGTLWEDWREGSSRNHVMFGDFSAWFYQSLAGIKLDGAPYSVVAETAPEHVAFKRFVVEPKTRPHELAPAGFEPLTRVAAVVGTPYGKIMSSWRVDEENGQTIYAIHVPFNTSATVILPCDENQTCEVIDGADDATKVDEARADTVVYEIGSGTWTFRVVNK